MALRPGHRAQPAAAAGALAVYVAAPLAANAVGTGSLSGLLVYAALPWTLHALARIHAATPFVPPADPQRARRLQFADVVVLGVIAAIVGAFVPVYPAVMVAAALAFALGSLVVGRAVGQRADGARQRRRRARRRRPQPALAAGRAALRPRPAGPSSASRPGVPTDLGLPALAAFDFGPNRLAVWPSASRCPSSPRSWPPARTVSHGRAGRPCSAVAGLATAWLVDRGTLPASPTLIPVFLAPYAVALAIGVACFVAGFTHDVRGTTFSWRQPLGVVALVGALVGLVPLAARAW